MFVLENRPEFGSVVPLVDTLLQLKRMVFLKHCFGHFECPLFVNMYF